MQANSSNVYAEIIKWSLSELQEKIKFSYHSLVRLKALNDFNFPWKAQVAAFSLPFRYYSSFVSKIWILLWLWRFSIYEKQRDVARHVDIPI